MSAPAHVEIPMADGTMLAADLRQPEQDGPAPTVIAYYPYHKDDFIGSAYEQHAHGYFVDHGYATLLVDFRGLGSSSGNALDAMHAQEGRDGAEIVEWTAAQDWCDGHVGMWGLSYGGITSFKTAAQKPPHLKAIIPIMASLDIYHDWVYPGGCRNALGAAGVWGSWMLAMQLMPPMQEDPDGRWWERWHRRLQSGRPYLLAWAEHPDHDAYWDERLVGASEIEVPMLSIGGWRDLFPQVMVDAFMRARGPRKLLMGPWLHVHPDESTVEPIDHLHHMVRWWDRWLKNESDGVEDEPPVQFYCQGEDRWVQAASWPPGEGAARGLLLGGDRTIAEAEVRAGEPEVRAGELLHTTDPTTGTFAGLWDPFGLGIGFPLDQTADNLQSLTFTGHELTEPLRIAGSPEAALELSFDAAGDAQLVVKLCDVAPDGSSSLITTGWLNARHRVSHAEPEVIEPGVRRTYRVHLWVTAYTLQTGHRLRVSVSGADFPRVWPTRTNPTFTLYAGADSDSSVKLPVAEDHALEPFTPEPSKPDVDRWPLQTDGEPIWRIERDLVRGSASVISGARFVFATPTQGGRVELEHTGRAEVRRERPDGATVTGDTVVRLTMPDGVGVEVTTDTLVTTHGMHLNGRVTVAGKVVFENAWAI